MSTKEKLIERFKQQPSDFTFDELVRLFKGFGYALGNKGSTSGSRVIFQKGNDCITLHKPHPGNTLKIGAMKCISMELKQRNLI